MSQQKIKESIVNFEKMISDLQKALEAEEKKLGFKTKAQTDKIEEIRSAKERVSLLKSVAVQHDRMGVSLATGIITAFAIKKFINELNTDKTEWANFMQEVILLCERITDEDMKDPEKVKKLFF